MLDDAPDKIACLRCGCLWLVEGFMSTDAAFYPAIQGRWFGVSHPHRVKAVVCLECGAVTQYLGRADVEKLRGKKAPPGDAT